ncbi:hypothetical protein [Actinotalea sp. C106]|uniref:hypothetical protein n=1 Tax=Actinotalea sp. C106 TaxID=2908644 RepID=UPI00202794A5|nr:hypothetical protein [Actinotalea sp. C106]
MALAIRRASYQRGDGRLVVRMGRRADISTGRRFALVLIPFLVAQVVVRVIHSLVGDVVLVVGACFLGYVVLVGVVHLIRRAEVRPRAERHGFVRTPAEEVGVWVLEETHHRGGFDEQSLRALRDLIEARVPAGETLYAAPMSQQYEDQLRSIGFSTAPGPRGRVQFERANVGGSTGHVRHDRALTRPQEESP